MDAFFPDWFAHPPVVAGLAATVLAIVVLVGLVRFFQWFAQKRTPCIEICDIKIIKPAYSSNSGYVSFRVVNTQGERPG